MDEPENGAIGREPDAVAASSLIPSKRPAPENGEPMDARSKKPEDGAEAISIKDACTTLFDPIQELSEQKLEQLSKIIFGDYLHLDKVPPASLMQGIRQYRFIEGCKVPFRQFHRFQFWLRETGQHASQKCPPPSGSDEDFECNVYFNTWVVASDQVNEMSPIEHPSIIGLPNWDRQLEQDTNDIFSRAEKRGDALESIIFVMSKIRRYTTRVTEVGLQQLARLRHSRVSEVPSTIRHACEPHSQGNSAISMDCEPFKDFYTMLAYESLYNMLFPVDDLDTMVTKALIDLRELPRLNKMIVELSLELGDADTSPDYCERIFTSLSVWKADAGKVIKQVSKSVRRAMHEARMRPTYQTLCDDHNKLDTEEKEEWETMRMFNNKRDKKLANLMGELLLNREKMHRGTLDPDIFVAELKRWRTLEQYDAVDVLLRHWNSLSAALNKLDESFG